MNNFKINDRVELLIDLVEGEQFISSSKQDIKKGSIGYVVDIIDDFNVSVEFSSEIYKDFVTTVNCKYLKKID